MKIVECVPNISEGRRPEVYNAIAQAAASVPGVNLLDIDPGCETNRTVITMVGDPDAVLEGVFQLIKKSVELIDMRDHSGAHPRMGATDVVPFVPSGDRWPTSARASTRSGADSAVPRTKREKIVSETIWRLQRGSGPLVATAIHDGHEVREDVGRLLRVDESGRLREEDPFTGEWAGLAPTQIVGTRSRFEVDLNRPRNSAVYLTPDDAWGIEVWNGDLPAEVAARSLAEYDAFYAALHELYTDLATRHGRFVVYDLHTYNHLREGPDGPAADPAANPQVNVGTGTMKDRSRWAGVIDRFVHDLQAFDFPGGSLDVRENVKFRGGNCGGWAHQMFPDAACVLSVEVKKFFMDEWTGEANSELLDAVGRALASTVPGVLEELGAA